MLELLLCSILTILPDFLFRRFVQGRRLGREITFVSVWYELRYGIVGCVILTLLLITVVFFFHPSSKVASSFFRTVPILPEKSGRVAEVFVGVRDTVTVGQPMFRLDSSAEEAAVETARRRVAEVDALIAANAANLRAAEGNLAQAKGALAQAVEEYDSRAELKRRNAEAIADRDVEKLKITVDTRQGAVDAAIASVESVRAVIEVQLPSQKASAEAQLAEAEIALGKTTVYAPFDGQLEQFALRPGDVINPMLRPAGILIPKDAGRLALQAAFGQTESQVIHTGMVAEVTCPSIAFTILPGVVTHVQSVIATGQMRPTDMLLDATQVPPNGTLMAYIEPLYPGGFDQLRPGSNCLVNLYTSNHDRLEDPNLGFWKRLGLHGVDTLGFVHALILRLQAVMIPVKTLVLQGGH